MSYSSPGLLTDESRWLAKIARIQSMMVRNQIRDGLYTQSVTFTIGDGDPLTPLNGTTDYNNTAMLNKSLLVLLVGTGTLAAGTDYNPIGTGGFTLLASTFDTGDTYTILY